MQKPRLVRTTVGLTALIGAALGAQTNTPPEPTTPPIPRVAIVLSGGGFSLGSITALGQIELTASAQDRGGGARLELNIGRMF